MNIWWIMLNLGSTVNLFVIPDFPPTSKRGPKGCGYTVTGERYTYEAGNLDGYR